MQYIKISGILNSSTFFLWKLMHAIDLSSQEKFKVYDGESKSPFFERSSSFWEYMLLKIISLFIDQNLRLVSPALATVLASGDIYKLHEPEP